MPAARKRCRRIPLLLRRRPVATTAALDSLVAVFSQRTDDASVQYESDDAADTVAVAGPARAASAALANGRRRSALGGPSATGSPATGAAWGGGTSSRIRRLIERFDFFSAFEVRLAIMNRSQAGS